MKDRYHKHRVYKKSRYHSKIRRLTKINQKYKQSKSQSQMHLINNTADDREDSAVDISPFPTPRKFSELASPINSQGKEKMSKFRMHSFKSNGIEPEEIPSWEKLNLSDKTRMFSYWVLLNMLGSVLI